MVNALKYTKELEKAGFTHEQAETSVQVLFEVMDDNFATKADIKALELTTKADFNALELAMKADLKAEVRTLEHKMDLRFAEVDVKLHDLENRLTIRLGMMLAASVTLTVALQRLA